MTLLLRHNGFGQPAEVEVTPLGGRGIAVVDFGQGMSLARVSVSAPAVTAQSVVTAKVAALATADHSADEHVVEEIEVIPGAPSAGVGFTLYARTRNVRLYGRWSIAWLWG